MCNYLIPSRVKNAPAFPGGAITKKIFFRRRILIAPAFLIMKLEITEFSRQHYLRMKRSLGRNQGNDGEAVEFFCESQRLWEKWELFLAREKRFGLGEKCLVRFEKCGNVNSHLNFIDWFFWVFWSEIVWHLIFFVFLFECVGLKCIKLLVLSDDENWKHSNNVCFVTSGWSCFELSRDVLSTIFDNIGS